MLPGWLSTDWKRLQQKGTSASAKLPEHPQNSDIICPNLPGDSGNFNLQREHCCFLFVFPEVKSVIRTQYGLAAD